MIFEKSGVLMTLDPGLGKTATTLTAIRDLLDSFQVTKVLVIAPLLVAEETWPAEIDTWEHTQVLSYELITGPAERREARAKLDAEIHIINRECIPWLVDFWGDDWPYDMLVVDESSCFRNPAKRTKPTKKAIEAWMTDPVNVPKPKPNVTRFGALCKVRKYFDKVVLLTGTPAPNGLMDLWSQLYLIDMGERLGSKFHSFRSRWFESDFKGYKWLPRPGALGQITERIADVTLSMRADDWLSLPERVDNTIHVHLTPSMMKKYKHFERTLIYADHDIEAINNGVLTQKMLQLASGGIYDEEGNAHEIHDLKLRALDLLIEEAAGKPVLVAYNYQFDLERLRRRYKGAEVLGEEENQVKRWNKSQIPVLLAHPASAAWGLNLQDGGHIAVWYSLPWSLEHYIQFNARLLRSGQKSTSVFIHHLIAVGTVDERVMEVLPDKAATQDAVVEATLYRPE